VLDDEGSALPTSLILFPTSVKTIPTRVDAIYNEHITILMSTPLHFDEHSIAFRGASHGIAMTRVIIFDEHC